MGDGGAGGGEISEVGDDPNPSLAVLPFDILSGDPEPEYFVAGLK
jgi:TolB-like protein